MPKGDFWYLRVPTGYCGCLLVPVDAYWCLSVPIGVCGCLLVSENG